LCFLRADLEPAREKKKKKKKLERKEKEGERTISTSNLAVREESQKRKKGKSRVFLVPALSSTRGEKGKKRTLCLWLREKG